MKDEYTFNVTIDDTKGTRDINKIPNVDVEMPLELTKHNIIYWNEDYKKLDGKPEYNITRFKAKKFVENDCIIYLKSDNIFFCLPIKDFNKISYHMEKVNDEWVCGCKKKEGHLICCHLLALKMQLQIWDYNKEEYKQKD